MRAKEMAMTRESKQASAEKLAQDLTRYLAEHGKASIDAALKKATAKIQKMKTSHLEMRPVFVRACLIISVLDLNA